MLAIAQLDWLCCIAALIFGGTEDAARFVAPKPDDPLQALIEKSNAMKSFVAEYHGKDGADEDFVLQLAYSAPDRLKIRIDGHGRESTCLLAWNRMEVHALSDDQGEMFASAVDQAIPSATVAKIMSSARSIFPEARIADLSDVVHVHIGFDLVLADDGKPSLDVKIARTIDREALLGWLPFLHEKARAPTEDADTIVFEADGDSRIAVQKSTGFLESVRGRWKDRETQLQLTNLNVDVPLAASAFHVPEHTARARDESDALAATMFWFQANGMRRLILDGIGQQFIEHESSWNADAKSKARRVLDTLYGEVFDARYASWIGRARPEIDAFCLWFQSARANAGTDPAKLAELTHSVEQYEQNTRDAIAAALEADKQGMRAPDDVANTTQVGRDLCAIGRSAFDAAFTRHVEGPLLGRFHLNIALARAGKLVAPAISKAQASAGR